MTILERRVDPESQEFRQNLERMDGLEADLRGRLAEAQAGGGEKATAFETKAKELGFENVTLGSAATETDVQLAILERCREKGYPEPLFYVFDEPGAQVRIVNRGEAGCEVHAPQRAPVAPADRQKALHSEDESGAAWLSDGADVETVGAETFEIGRRLSSGLWIG